MPDAPRSVLVGPLLDALTPETDQRPAYVLTMPIPFGEFNLSAEVERLHLETAWQTGRAARTLINYDEFRVVLTALRSGTRISEHKTDGRISFHALSGRLRLNAVGRAFDLRPGCLVALDQGEPHDLEALEDSVVLLTIAWPESRDMSNGHV